MAISKLSTSCCNAPQKTHDSENLLLNKFFLPTFAKEYIYSTQVGTFASNIKTKFWISKIRKVQIPNQDDRTNFYSIFSGKSLPGPWFEPMTFRHCIFCFRTHQPYLVFLFVRFLIGMLWFNSTLSKNCACLVLLTTRLKHRNPLYFRQHWSCYYQVVFHINRTGSSSY